MEIELQLPPLPWLEILRQEHTNTKKQEQQQQQEQQEQQQQKLDWKKLVPNYPTNRPPFTDRVLTREEYFGKFDDFCKRYKNIFPTEQRNPSPTEKLQQLWWIAHERYQMTREDFDEMIRSQPQEMMSISITNFDYLCFSELTCSFYDVYEYIQCAMEMWEDLAEKTTAYDRKLHAGTYYAELYNDDPVLFYDILQHPGSFDVHKMIKRLLAVKQTFKPYGKFYLPKTN